MFTPERERRESRCAVYVTHFGPFWDRMVGWGVKRAWACGTDGAKPVLASSPFPLPYGRASVPLGCLVGAVDIDRGPGGTYIGAGTGTPRDRERQR